MKIAFFDTKPYDRSSFDELVPAYEVEIKYFESKLTRDTVSMAKGFDAVCAFVNDDLGREVLDSLAGFGVRLVVLRCAGYNNVNLETAYGEDPRPPRTGLLALCGRGTRSRPHPDLNRKTHKAYNRTRENNFSIDGLTGMDLHGKTAGNRRNRGR